MEKDARSLDVRTDRRRTKKEVGERRSRRLITTKDTEDRSIVPHDEADKEIDSSENSYRENEKVHSRISNEKLPGMRQSPSAEQIK